MIKDGSKRHEDSGIPQLLTSSGLKIDVRLASPKDEPLVLDLLRSVSPDDLRFRFLDAVRPSQALARMLTRVERGEVENLLGFDASDGRLVATAMIAAQSRNTAEVAVVVRSDLKGRGIGWAMLSHACKVARDRGFARVDCLESRANQAAILLETEQGFSKVASPGDEMIMILSKELA